MVQCIEVFGHVYKHCAGVSLLRIPLYFLNRLLCASVRMIAVAVFREKRFVDWNQLLCDRLLDDGCEKRAFTFGCF